MRADPFMAARMRNRAETLRALRGAALGGDPEAVEVLFALASLPSDAVRHSLVLAAAGVAQAAEARRALTSTDFAPMSAFAVGEALASIVPTPQGRA